MNNFLRKNKAVIVWAVVFAFVIGGTLFGFGVYFSGQNSSGVTPASGVAQVNKEPISVDEYYAGLRNIAEQLQSMTSQQQILAYQYQVLDTIIDARLLMQEAKKQKIKVKVTQEDINKYIEDVKAEYSLSDEQITEILADQGLTVEQWSRDLEPMLEQQKIVDTLLEKITGEVNVTDQEIKDKYEQVHVNNIKVTKGENAEEAKGKAEEALAKLKSGQDFLTVAVKYSDDPNAENGADLGFLSRENASDDSLVLTAAAFATEVGQVTDIVETTDAYNILKVVEKKVAEGEEFDEQKVTIKEDLIESKKSEIQDEWFQDLKNKAKINIHIPELAGYRALISEDYKVAIDKFEEAEKVSGGNDTFLAYLAIAYNAIGEKDKAIANLTKAIEMAPTNYELYMALGSMYRDMDEKEKAIEQFQKASENAGDEYMVHFQLQQEFVQLGRVDLAQEEQTLINEIYERVQKQFEAEQAAAESNQ